MEDYLEFEQDITVLLSDFMHLDMEDAYDMLSEKACGNDLLMDINYEVQGGQGDKIKLTVQGDASQAIEFMSFSKVQECWPERFEELFIEGLQGRWARAPKWLKEASDETLEETFQNQTDETLIGLLTHNHQEVRQIAFRCLKVRGIEPNSPPKTSGPTR